MFRPWTSARVWLWLGWFALWLSLGGVFVGCSSTSGSCTEGEQATCNCPDGQGLGLQTCTNGQWSACASCGSTSTSCRTPGETQTCACPSGGGVTGTQTCSDSKQWGACSCTQTGACQPGATSPCTCAGNQSGQQTCESNGAWGACKCDSLACSDGATRECVCSATQNLGSQTCANGVWGVCGSCTTAKECDKEGETQTCRCPNGARSRQTCQADKTWSACNCGGPVCTLGETSSCTCPTGFKSTQTCIKDSNDNPKWGDCDCSCKDGDTKPCECPNQQQGAYSCSCSGGACQWSACKCPTCKSDQDCASFAKAKYCDGTITQCVECKEKLHCTDASMPFCSPTTATCVACLEDTDCAGGTTCDPLTQACSTIGKGTLSGTLTRCKEGVARPAGCAGNVKRGDDQGPIYFLFFSGKNFPPRYSEKPFLVHKIDKTDFSDSAKTLSYKIDNVPAGTWLVFVFLDDNNNWSPGQHMPDPGDLVAVSQGVEVKANASSNSDFFLFDRY